MIKRLFSQLFSTRLMAILFIVFAVAMGLGTFIEHWYNTDAARKLIYNAWWFEGTLVLFVLNFLGNIRRYNLYKKRKWPVLLLHLSFILIIIGAFCTRYIGFEGTMSIREGSSSNRVISKETYLTTVVEGEESEKIHRLTIEKPILLSPLADNSFEIQDQLVGQPFEISYNKFFMNGARMIKENSEGDLYLKLVVASGQTSDEYFLKEGEVQLINNVLFAFNNHVEEAVNITKVGKKYSIAPPKNGISTRMSDEKKEKLLKGKSKRLHFKWLYEIGKIKFVIPQFAQRGYLGYESNNDYKDSETDDVLVLNVRVGNSDREVTLKGDKGKSGNPIRFEEEGLKFTLSFGSKVYRLPFRIKLKDFIAEKYPGTEESYSSFKSKVSVLDSEGGFDTDIFMNNVLDHKGYRFFQASFHPDEKGTILSVNHDFWGTWITYIGYFLLYVGLVSILFDKNSRFGRVRRKLKRISSSKVGGIALILLTLLSPDLLAQNTTESLNDRETDKFLSTSIVNKKHAAKFGRLVIQDGDGRMKPINTFSSELIRKVYNDDFFRDYTSDQVFLSMIQFPDKWYSVPVIKLGSKSKKIHEIIDQPLNKKYIALHSLFDEEGFYKLSTVLGEAYRAFIPNQFQEDVIELDRKANLLHFALSGEMLRIFPIPNDPNNTWVSLTELNESLINGSESLFTKNILPLYLSSLTEALETGDYSRSVEFLQKIESFQKRYGEEVRPSETKISTEVAYNEANIFEKLFQWYLWTGLAMILFGILSLLNKKWWLGMTSKAFRIVVFILFLFHTVGLIMRWYIAGHAPWSDAYESIVYVSWATILFGLYFGRKSDLTLGATAFIGSIILMVAHWNWMDPAIANLEPVLNSYWLMVHVAIIVASYGPFTLGMILGLISLLLMAFITNKNKSKLKVGITELTYITELSLTVGLVMLTIGNFLGGQWANESWGRYWGWDPKETWALISIIIYAFVIHLRIVPKLKGKWLFNLMSVLAYYSILMTYFGVNFYLSGLHSYASGDKVVTPSFIYYSVAAIGIVATFAYFKDKKYLRTRSPGI